MNYGSVIAPAADAFPITPSNTAYLRATALYVGTGGDVAVVTEANSTVTFANVPDGSVLPVRVKQVLSTGTTASDILGLRG